MDGLWDQRWMIMDARFALALRLTRRNPVQFLVVRQDVTPGTKMKTAAAAFAIVHQIQRKVTAINIPNSTFGIWESLPSVLIYNYPCKIVLYF